MAENLKNITGITGESLSIGQKTKKATISVDTNVIKVDKQLDLQTHKIINVVDPTSNQDAATKKYVDDTASGAITTHVGLSDPHTQYILESEKGANSGVATLNSSGKLTAAQVPAIAITDTFVIASESAMLALSTAETGDVAVRTDINKSFILKGTDYATLSDWQELLTPTDSVLSVNGQSGTVVLDAGDIGYSNTTSGLTATTTQGAVDELASEKADKVTSATNGHLAQLDANGNLADSGLATSDVVTGSSTDTFTNKTFDANGTGNSISNLEKADFASSAIQEGASGDNTKLTTKGYVDTAISSSAKASVLDSIAMSIGTNSSYTSTAQVPANAVIEKIVVKYTTIYDNSATIAVSIDSATLVASTDTDSSVLGNNIFELYDVNANASTVSVAVANTPTAGVAKVIVYYSVPQA